MFSKIFILIMLIGCSNEFSTTESAPMSNTWLSLEEYFAKDCFYLSEKLGYVVTYAPKEHDVSVKDWSWSYEPPNKYTIRNYNIEATRIEGSNGCWNIKVLGLNDIACPCELSIPANFDTGTY